MSVGTRAVHLTTVSPLQNRQQLNLGPLVEISEQMAEFAEARVQNRPPLGAHFGKGRNRTAHHLEGAKKRMGISIRIRIVVK